MTKTIDQRARELLAKRCDERTAAAIGFGATVIIETVEALAAITEALTRIETVEKQLDLACRSLRRHVTNGNSFDAANALEGIQNLDRATLTKGIKE